MHCVECDYELCLPCGAVVYGHQTGADMHSPAQIRQATLGRAKDLAAGTVGKVKDVAGGAKDLVGGLIKTGSVLNSSTRFAAPGASNATLGRSNSVASVDLNPTSGSPPSPSHLTKVYGTNAKQVKHEQKTAATGCFGETPQHVFRRFDSQLTAPGLVGFVKNKKYLADIEADAVKTHRFLRHCTQRFLRTAIARPFRGRAFKSEWNLKFQYQAPPIKQWNADLKEARKALRQSKKDADHVSSTATKSGIDFDNPHGPVQCGFDVYFNDYVKNTKPGNWPVMKGSKKTLRTSSSMMICFHFLVFQWRRMPWRSWKAFFWACCEGMCAGSAPQMYGWLVDYARQADEYSGFYSGKHHADDGSQLPYSNGTYTEMPGDRRLDAAAPDRRLHDKLQQEVWSGSLVWLSLYFLAYLFRQVAKWNKMRAVPSSNQVVDLRTIMWGRMMRFRPLPVVSEAAFVIENTAQEASASCFQKFFDRVEDLAAVGTILCVLMYNMYTMDQGEDVVRKEEIQNGPGTFAMFTVLPMSLQILFAWFFFSIRKFINVNAIRSKRRWLMKMSGYTTVAATYQADRLTDTSKFDQAVLKFHGVCHNAYAWHNLELYLRTCPKMVNDVFAWLLVCGLTAAAINNCMNGGWPMKQFVIMSSCYVLLTQYVADMLTDIAEHPCGFDAVLRCAQIVNHTDLVDPYVLELNFKTNENSKFGNCI